MRGARCTDFALGYEQIIGVARDEGSIKEDGKPEKEGQSGRERVGFDKI